MRVLYLHQYFNTPQMSGSTRSYEIGRRLAAAGHKVEMITSWQGASGERGWRTESLAGMRIHWLPVAYSNHMGFAARLWAFFHFALAAARRAATLPCDVIYASSTPLTIALPGVYAARRQRVPMVFEVRDLWPELPIAVGALRSPLSKWAARALERFAYANATRIVALSSGMAQGVAASGYPRERIAVVPNGAELERFRPDAQAGRQFREQHGIAASTILVGYVGTLGKINEASYLVEVAAALKSDARLRLLIVGDGIERAKVSQLACEYGVLGHNLLMLEKMPKAQMPQVFAALDVATSVTLPLPELEANSANKFFDALAAGCCVAVNYGGWQAEVLAHSGAGIRLHRNPERAASQLRELADDRKRLKQMGEAARALAEERYSLDRLSAQVAQVLQAAVQEHVGS